MSTIDYSSIKASALLAIYNEAAKALGERTVTKFSDKPTGVKRTQAIVQRANEIAGFVEWLKTQESVGPAKAAVAEKKAAPVAAPAKVAKKERRISFTFKPLRTQKAPKGEGSLRTLCLAKLLAGAKFDAVVKLVEKFDTNRGKGNGETIERRAYELVRIMHYQLGYGIKHDETTGLIQVYN